MTLGVEAFNNIKVVGVMRWCDFNDTCAFFHVRVFVCEDWDFAIDKRYRHSFTDDILVAFIFGIDNDCHIAEQGFWTCCCDFNIAWTICQRISDVVERTFDILVDNFDIWKRCAGCWIPVDDEFTTVDKAFFVKFNKNFFNRFW